MARLARWEVCPQVAGADFLPHQATPALSVKVKVYNNKVPTHPTPAICPSKFKITNSPRGVHRWDKLTSVKLCSVAKLSLYLTEIISETLVCPFVLRFFGQFVLLFCIAQKRRPGIVVGGKYIISLCSNTQFQGVWEDQCVQ